MNQLNLSVVDDSATELWGGLVPVLSEGIVIPALSPAFDSDWAANGHMRTAPPSRIEPQTVLAAPRMADSPVNIAAPIMASPA
jgi:hypothetical protein